MNKGVTSELYREWCLVLVWLEPAPETGTELPADRKTGSKLLLLVTPRYSKSSSAACNGTSFSKSIALLERPYAAAFDPNSFLKPEGSVGVFSNRSRDGSSAPKSGSGLVTVLLFRRKSKKTTTSAPMTIVPPMEPTKPPISFALLLEEPVEGLLTELAAVGTVTNVVIVVSGSTLMVEMYELNDSEDRGVRWLVVRGRWEDRLVWASDENVDSAAEDSVDGAIDELDDGDAVEAVDVSEDTVELLNEELEGKAELLDAIELLEESLDDRDELLDEELNEELCADDENDDEEDDDEEDDDDEDDADDDGDELEDSLELLLG